MLWSVAAGYVTDKGLAANKVPDAPYQVGGVIDSIASTVAVAVAAAAAAAAVAAAAAAAAPRHHYFMKFGTQLSCGCFPLPRRMSASH